MDGVSLSLLLGLLMVARKSGFQGTFDEFMAWLCMYIAWCYFLGGKRVTLTLGRLYFSAVVWSSGNDFIKRLYQTCFFFLLQFPLLTCGLADAARRI